jgi:ABC-type multidrug transport system ATPase subunit
VYLGHRAILSNVSLIVKPGETMAIIGHSGNRLTHNFEPKMRDFIRMLLGAGKSTCLDIMALKHKNCEFSGEVLYNGRHLSRKQARNMIG